MSNSGENVDQIVPIRDHNDHDNLSDEFAVHRASTTDTIDDDHSDAEERVVPQADADSEAERVVFEDHSGSDSDSGNDGIQNPLEDICGDIDGDNGVNRWAERFAGSHVQEQRMQLLKCAARYEYNEHSVVDPDFPEDEKDILMLDINGDNGSSNGKRALRPNHMQRGSADETVKADRTIVQRKRKKRPKEKSEKWHLQSRSLKTVVYVIGILSATCQGWYQSVVSGTSRSRASSVLIPVLI